MNMPDDLKLPSFIEVPFDQFFNRDFIQQHEWETRTFLRMVLDNLKPERTVELGTWKGGMAVLLSCASKVTVTIDNQDYGVELARSHGFNLTFMADDCRTESCIQNTMRILGGPIDLLFIDDSHIYEDVKREVEIWKPYVCPGGWICFHDINPLANRGPDGKHSHLCQAHRLWSEIEGNKREIIANEKHSQFRGVIPHGGIGILTV